MHLKPPIFVPHEDEAARAGRSPRLSPFEQSHRLFGLTSSARDAMKLLEPEPDVVP